jgi:hypothetical protein
MQKKVFKGRNPNPLLRSAVWKEDEDKIAAWKQDLVRVLHVFNVGSFGLIVYSRPNNIFSD